VPEEEVRELESYSGCWSLGVFLEVQKDNSGVKTFAASDCSGTGSLSNSIRAVIPVMGVHSGYSDCSFEYKSCSQVNCTIRLLLTCESLM